MPFALTFSYYSLLMLYVVQRFLKAALAPLLKISGF